MELLNYARTDYLLDSPLESLHKESVAWLKELDFLSDEISFFYKLLHRQKHSELFPSEEVAEIDRNLVKLSSEGVEKLKHSVAGHERQLAAALKSGSVGEEQSYRESHKKLLGDLYNLLSEIRAFKTKVFSIVKK